MSLLGTKNELLGEMDLGKDDERRLRLEQQNNYTHSPGTHTKRSPVPGSRWHELEMLIQHRNIFKEYQNVVHENQKLNVIPLDKKGHAESLSKELFSQYISKYSTLGVTIDNAVYWSDQNLTRTYLSDLENEWNTWRVFACVANPFHDSHVENGMYRPAYICALHELMHVEETPVGISESKYNLLKDINEVLTVTRTLILNDQVYKEVHELPLDQEIDYGVSFNLFGKCITQGALANFYRGLEAKYSSLGECLTSPESLEFLGCIGANKLERERRERIARSFTPLKSSREESTAPRFDSQRGYESGSEFSLLTP